MYFETTSRTKLLGVLAVFSEVLDITERFVRTVHDRLLRQDPDADYDEDRVTLKDAEAMLTVSDMPTHTCIHCLLP